MGWGFDFVPQGEFSAWSRYGLTCPPFSPSHTPAPEPPLPALPAQWFCSGRLLTSGRCGLLCCSPLTASEGFQGEGEALTVCCQVLRGNMSLQDNTTPQLRLRPTDSDCPRTSGDCWQQVTLSPSVLKCDT